MNDLVRLPVLVPESCNECGLCCEGIGSPVLLYQSYHGMESSHPVRPPGLPAELIAEIDEHFLGLSRGQEPQEGCLWFDPVHRMCRHYEWRPPVCRDYELGGSGCIALRRPFVRPEGDRPHSGT